MREEHNQTRTRRQNDNTSRHKTHEKRRKSNKNILSMVSGDFVWSDYKERRIRRSKRGQIFLRQTYIRAPGADWLRFPFRSSLRSLDIRPAALLFVRTPDTAHTYTLRLEYTRETVLPRGGYYKTSIAGSRRRKVNGLKVFVRSPDRPAIQNTPIRS